jgi:inorganic pyrophosphatase
MTTGCDKNEQSRVEPRGSDNYVTGYTAISADGLINVVIEIPAGTSAKWEVSKDGTAVEWEMRGGKPRFVHYLAYPANYGMIPGTIMARELGGDGDPLDVVLLGPAVPRGAVVAARPIGVLRLLDDGERDDKVLAVQSAGPLSDVADLDDLRQRYPGAAAIIETWFTHYKGVGRLESGGMEGRDAALAVVREAVSYFTQTPGS